MMEKKGVARGHGNAFGIFRFSAALDGRGEGGLALNSTSHFQVSDYVVNFKKTKPNTGIQAGQAIGKPAVTQYVSVVRRRTAVVVVVAYNVVRPQQREGTKNRSTCSSPLLSRRKNDLHLSYWRDKSNVTSKTQTFSNITYLSHVNK
jgi:hypothetical protein